MSLSLARKKAWNEKGWSAAIIVIMVAGLSVWLVLPSIGQSLQSGFSSYADEVGTYVVVNFNGYAFAQNRTLSQGTISAIRSIAGVQKVYPIVAFETDFLYPNLVMNESGFTVRGMTEEVESAVIGGPSGFPTSLVALTSGHAPVGAEPGFVINAAGVSDPTNGKAYTVGQITNMSIARVNFTATVVGINTFNPLVNIPVLWNATFLQSELGQSLFAQTASGDANLLIVQVATVGQVEAVASQVTNVLTSYPDFSVTYDQATVTDLLSVESSTTPIYNLIGVVSLVSSVVAVLLISYIAVRRRNWETGLLVSQGWTWSQVANFLWSYFIILAGVAYVLSILLSLAVAPYATFSYQVYGSTLHINTSIGLFAYASAALIAIAVTIAVSQIMKWRLKKAGLDAILRDY